MSKNEVISNVIMALCELCIGILLLIDPIGFTAWIFITFGIVLVVMGLMEIVSYFRTDPAGALVRQSLAIGLAQVAAGCFCIFRYNWFIVTFPLLTLLYGVMSLLAGFVKIQWTVDMLRMRQKKWYLAAISAALSVIFAGMILSNPFTSTAALWSFVAVSLIVEAAVDVVALIFRKKNAG